MQKPPDIFARLAKRGVSDEYGTIKQIVSFGLPQMILLYTRQFGHRPIAQVLRQIDQWKLLLAKDVVLSETQRSELLRTILGAEALVWNALIEANLPQVGPWTLRIGFVPTGEDESGQPLYVYPPVRVTAVNRETHTVQQLLGHSTIRMTARYAHSLWEDKEAAVKLLEGASVSGTRHYLDTAAQSGVLPAEAKSVRIQAAGA